VLTDEDEAVIYAAQIEGRQASRSDELGLNDPDEKLERCPSG
jgi:hypothetical protein